MKCRKNIRKCGKIKKWKGKRCYMNEIEIINIGIGIVFLLFLYSGYKDGFLWKCISILGFFITGWLSWILSKPISLLFALYPIQHTPFQGTILEPFFYDKLNQILVFAILFIILEIVILCIRPLAKLIGKLPIISYFNRWLGVCLSGIQAILFFSVIAFILNMPITNNSRYYAQNSVLKYCEPITIEIWKVIEQPMLDFMNFYEQGEIEKPLNEKQKQDFENWLIEKKLDKENVHAFIEALR